MTVRGGRLLVILKPSNEFMRYLILLAFLYPMVLFGQPNEGLKIISPVELRADAAALRNALEKYHPGLYWYTTQQEFKSTWDSLDRALDQPLNELEFFKLLL